MQNVNDFSLWVFRPPVAAKDRERFDAAFALWLEVWRSANAEMNKPTDISSDAFTRQSEILCLFKAERPVAMICLRECDFESESTYYDSIFMHPGMWREKDKDVVRRLGGKGVFGSLITVAPDYRQTEGPISMKYLIVLLALERSRAMGAETVVSIIRGRKGLDRVFEKAGCIVINKERAYGSTHADLVAFRPQIHPVQFSSEYVDAIRELWSKARFSEKMQLPAPPVERKVA